MLERVAIKGFKSLVDVDVKLQPLTVLFGPNAAGKSNFLDALQLLSRFVSGETLSEAFDRPFRGKPIEVFNYGASGLQELLSKDSIVANIEIDLSLSRQTREKFRIFFEQQHLRLAGEKVPFDLGKFDPRLSDSALRYALTYTYDTKSGSIQNREESITELSSGNKLLSLNGALEFASGYSRGNGTAGNVWSTISVPAADHGRKSAISWLGHLSYSPHLWAIKEELSEWQFIHLEPREAMRSVESLREVYRLGPSGEGLSAYLNTLKTVYPTKFESIQRGLRVIVPSVERIETRIDGYGNIELGIVENGVPVSARLMSEGTLRILGLLAVCVGRDRPTLVGLEEPENGIPPGRLADIAEFLRTQTTYNGTQFIVTTHSPRLTDLVPESSLFACRKQNGSTSITPFAMFGGQSRGEQIGVDLEDDEPLTPSERILRGDFNGPV